MPDSNLHTLGDPQERKPFPDIGEYLREQERKKKLEEKLRGKKAQEEITLETTDEETPEVAKESVILTITNPEDYILLPGKTHGSYSYEDLFVLMYRLGMSSEVEQVANQLGYQLSNSAKESNGRDYIGNINWKQALSLNLALGGRTLNPRQFADFLLLLKSGNAVDGVGKRVSKQKLTNILKEIIEVREPWRSEWLDADFKYLNRKLWLYSDHKLANVSLDANYKKELENCLMEDVKISLDSINEQGLPTKTGNDFNYWFSREDNKSVAGFVANSDRALLGCCGNPASTNPSLGVRASAPAGARVQKI
jgi:hypothetical protein